MNANSRWLEGRQCLSLPVVSGDDFCDCDQVRFNRVPKLILVEVSCQNLHAAEVYLERNPFNRNAGQILLPDQIEERQFVRDILEVLAELSRVAAIRRGSYAKGPYTATAEMR